MVELTNTMARMDVVISNTASELSLTQTNNSYLQTELQSQMAQRAELEHKFNDINEVRTQISKLKEEIFIQSGYVKMSGEHDFRQ